MRIQGSGGPAACLVFVTALGVGAGGCDNPVAPPPPPPPPPVVVPTLLAPASGSALGNDCTGGIWAFDWSDVPNASQYHLVIRREGAAAPVIDAASLGGSDYRWVREPSIVPEAERRGWRWQVRAMVEGTWRDWSPESAFEVDPLYPRLTSPSAGALLDNGCTNSPERINWEFRWSACASASRYHLYVIGPSATIPVVDDDRLRDAAFDSSRIAWVGDPNRRGWRWQVRARFAEGWGDWSPEQTFDVEPVNTDCGR